MMDTALPLALALLFGHYAGDYLIQTDKQACGKLDKGRAGLRHAAAHVAGLTGAQGAWIGAFALCGAPVSLAGALAALALNAVTHLLIDWGRRGPDWWCHVTGSPNFYDHAQPDGDRLTHTHGGERADQALHYQVIGLAALLGAML